jgi:nitroimidazol reductase NimA-like FMN-containing flavoprotein (pyridoxamine 5'-phosphate oxidase superfamily)
MTLAGSDAESIALTRVECEHLLRTSAVGRVAFTDGALPQVLPVNYCIDETSIVFRTAARSRLASCCRDAVVAFEVDDIDRHTQLGWSVLVVGDAATITDHGQLGRMRELPCALWTDDESDPYIRIVPGIVNGRRVRAIAN